MHALAGMRGNLRLLTWIFDRLDPAIKHNTKLLYKARDLMQRLASFLLTSKYQYYGKQTNQYTQSQLAYLWELNMDPLTNAGSDWKYISIPKDHPETLKYEKIKERMA